MGQPPSSIGAAPLPPSLSTMPICGFDSAAMLPDITLLPWMETTLRLCAEGTDAFFGVVDSLLGAHETRLDRFLVGYQTMGLVLFIVLTTLHTLAKCLAPAKTKKP